MTDFFISWFYLLYSFLLVLSPRKRQKTFQFERKNNNQRKKIALFGRQLERWRHIMTSRQQFYDIMGACFILVKFMSLLAAEDVKMKCNKAGSNL